MSRLTLLALLMCAFAGTTSGTTLPLRTTRDLVRLATQICCVRCESVEARVDQASGMVFTHVRVRRLENYKLEDDKGGRGDAVFSLRLIGGKAGGRETRVAGMPRFCPGAECVLFLGKRNRAGFPVVLQAHRGAIAVRLDKKSGQRHLGQAVTGLTGLPATRRVSLNRFAAAVRRAVRADRKAKR